VHTTGLSYDIIIVEYTHAKHRVMLSILTVSALIVERVMTPQECHLPYPGRHHSEEISLLNMFKCYILLHFSLSLYKTCNFHSVPYGSRPCMMCIEFRVDRHTLINIVVLLMLYFILFNNTVLITVYKIHMV